MLPLTTVASPIAVIVVEIEIDSIYTTVADPSSIQLQQLQLALPLSRNYGDSRRLNCNNYNFMKLFTTSAVVIQDTWKYLTTTMASLSLAKVKSSSSTQFPELWPCSAT